MPVTGGGTYSLPGGTLATTGTAISSSAYNGFLNDLVTVLNTAKAIAKGGTGATTAAGARSNLSVDIATSYALKSAGYTLVADDKGSLIEFDGAYTAALTAAATLGSGWSAVIYANGGDVTIDPDSSETINGSSTFTLSDGYFAFVWCDGSNFKCLGNNITVAQVTALIYGQQTIWVPAGAMTPTATNGAALTIEELATNDVMITFLAFDDSTRENACFSIQMPKGWNEGTLISQFVWKCGVTSGNVIWGIQARAVGNDDALDAAYGTAQEVTDGATAAADDCLITSETSALTVAGTPAAEDLVNFKVYRDAADGSDTLSGDAELIGVKIHYTIDAAIDD